MVPESASSPGGSLKVVLATRNAGKVKEMHLLLADLPVTLLSVADFDDVPEVIEDQPSLQGNAVKKAQALFDATGIPSLADDTGLEVDALFGRPGVRSARYAGENASDSKNRALLLHELQNVSDRTARFCTVAAYVDGNSICLFEGTCEGSIRNSEAGTDGFGYDAVFEPKGFQISFAEMSTEVKNGISHRGKAMAKFKAYMMEKAAVHE
ncbi:MAG: RdgB/HAM1 family non-canonical purine NTP pyrophosphatase [Bacteroidetes bacterium]|nr:MAG: RdgB/HAM1 family non-canonical purine NTP pyrophosphatase [Bacteroidota bacterium]